MPEPEIKPKKSERGIRAGAEGYYKNLVKKHNGVYHRYIATGKTIDAVMADEERWRKEIEEKNLFPERKVDILDKGFKLKTPEYGGFSVVMIGASRSGKTSALKHIVKDYMDKKLLFLTSFNDHAMIYKDLPKRTLISSSFHPELLKDFHTLQHETNNKYKACFIYDDAIGNELKNNQQITKLLTIYRNANCDSIFSAQSPTLVSPAGRSNANYIMLFKLNSSSDIELTIKEWLQAYFPKGMSMVEKIKWYNDNTADHHFILIDNINGTICRSKLSAEQLE